MNRKLASFICLLVALTSFGSGQSLRAATDFQPIIRSDWDAAAVAKANQGTLGLTRSQTPDGPVVQVETKVRLQSFYQASIAFQTTQPVAKGDVLWLTLKARMISATNEQREAEYVVFFQQDKAPWEKSVTHAVSVGGEWTTLELPFMAKSDLAPGEGSLELGVGFRPQTIEFAKVELRNYHQTTTINDLPKTHYMYGGREDKAPWRAEAMTRIESLRKSPFTVTVLDDSGKPFSGASVEVTEERSSFQFGSCVDSNWILKTGPDADRYRKTLLENFNTAVIENGLKWPMWSADDPSGFCPRSQTLQALDWLSQQSLTLRGHNLAWPGWGYTAKRYVPPAIDGGDLRRLETEHIRDEVGATYGKLQAWDVVNESLHEKDYFKYMDQDDSIGEWFRVAHETDPRPQLFLNDYEMLTGADSRLIVQEMVKQADRLRAKGVCVQGLGVQCHFGQSVLAMDRLKQDLDLLTTARLPILVTEFDVNSPDEDFSADLLRDMLILCYSEPSVQGFVIWGFWEKAHWIPQAAMYRSDWSERPSAKVWRDLVLTQWKTHATGTTNEQGLFTGDGYHGTYIVKVQVGDHTEIRRFELAPGGGSATVFLPKLH